MEPYVLTREDLLAAMDRIRNGPYRPWRMPPMSRQQFDVFKYSDVGLLMVYGFDVKRGAIVAGWAH